jgi:glycine betaine catabolism A
LPESPFEQRFVWHKSANTGEAFGGKHYLTERALEVSLPRRAYCDAEFYRREQASIFWDQWFYAGRADRFPHPGAFAVLDVAGESIVVVRGDDGALHGHYNLCRHRGSRLLCGEGVVRGAIRCPYHGWAYALDGRLIATPFVEECDVPEQARRLHPVGVDVWGGFLFVNLALAPQAARARTLRAQLGAIPERLARYPLDELRSVRTIRYEAEANWKVLLENYNECYHCAGVHPELCRVVPAFKRRGGSELDWERGIPHRDGAWTFTFSGTANRRPFSTLDEDERVRHKGELIYPNFLLSLSADHVAAFSLWPQSPLRTVVECDFLFHPEQIAQPDFDPSDAIEFWDLVNRQDWAICSSVQAGMNSHAFEYGFYAPMEDASLDIRRYIASRLGEDAVRI